MFELSTLTSQPALSMNHLRLLPVALPPIPEQIQIAEIGSAHDARLRAEEAYRAKLQQVKQGLMADLLTGKVRV
jgi:type I restriction enzyme S subunit